MRRFLCLIILFAFVTLPLSAQDTATFPLAWDYSDADTLFLIDEGGGFKLYVSNSSSGPFSLIATVSDPTNKTVTVDTSALRGRNYFVVTAFIPTAESDPSNVVDAVFKPASPGNLRK